MRRLIAGLMCIGLLAGCQQKAVNPPHAAPTVFASQPVKETSAAKRLARFTAAKFVQSDGVLNGIGTANAKDQAFLSESTGLWLLHLAYTHQDAAFQKFYAASKKKLYNGQAFSYRISRPGNNKSAVNASGDDLRIMRALLVYDETTKTKRYRKESAKLFANWAEHCVQAARLKDFYDTRLHQTSQQGSLAYFDLQTLHYFQSEKAYRQQLAVVQAGYLGDAFPLYASSYNYSDHAYSSKNLNTSEALETLLQLARAGKLKAATKAWLIQRVIHDDLPNAMSVTGGVVDTSTSVANWALLAQIFAAIHDAKHYDQTMALIWAQQVRRGQLAGGFGDAQTGSAFAYNNLNVLLAADMRGQAHANAQ